jgi:hypothetical protein
MAWPGSKGAFFGGLAAVLVAAAIVAVPASAKSTYESPYGYDRTWNAALRLVRVDNGWKITEKDSNNGYLLFEYTSPQSSKSTAGSIELVKARDADSFAVSVLVQLPQMPHYHEQVILDALASKMRREYGDAPDRKPAPQPTPKELPDGGSPGGDD